MRSSDGNRHAQGGLDLYRDGVLRPLLPHLPAGRDQRCRERRPGPTSAAAWSGNGRPSQAVARPLRQANQGSNRQRSSPPGRARASPSSRSPRSGLSGSLLKASTATTCARARAMCPARSCRTGREPSASRVTGRHTGAVLPPRRARQGRPHHRGDQDCNVRVRGQPDQDRAAHRHLGPRQRARARRHASSDHRPDHLQPALLGSGTADRLRRPGVEHGGNRPGRRLKRYGNEASAQRDWTTPVRRD
jgi:hypothetical protein